MLLIRYPGFMEQAGLPLKWAPGAGGLLGSVWFGEERHANWEANWMRVIAGTLRSRPLLAPAGMGTRPTADRLRETLFNVLTQGAVDRVAGAAFLDLYAGSGAVGIEAMSRGASSVTFVEKDAAALGVLTKNLAALGLRGPEVRVHRRSVSQYLRGLAGQAEADRFGVVFLDPPYDLAADYAATLNLLGKECVGLLAERYGALVRVRLKEQGDAGLSFYELESLPPIG